MPRTKRIQISGATQLLYQRGHNGAVAFTRESDYQTYLESLHDSATMLIVGFMLTRCFQPGFTFFALLPGPMGFHA